MIQENNITKKTRTRHKDINCQVPKSCCQNMSLFLDSLIFSNFHFPYSLDFSSTFNCFQAFCVCVFFYLIQVLVRNILGILMVIWFLKRMAVYLLAMLIWLQMMIYKLVESLMNLMWFLVRTQTIEKFLMNLEARLSLFIWTMVGAWSCNDSNSEIEFVNAA